MLNETLSSSAKPFVLTLKGTSRGSGASLIFSSPYSVAYDKMRVSFNECEYGYCPDGGSLYYLSRLPFEFGTFLALTGYCLTEEDLLTLKLIDDINFDMGLYIDHKDILPQFNGATENVVDEPLKPILKFKDNNFTSTDFFDGVKRIVDKQRFLGMNGEYHNFFEQFSDVVVKNHLIGGGLNKEGREMKGINGQSGNGMTSGLSFGFLRSRIERVFSHDSIDAILNELSKEPNDDFTNFCIYKIKNSSKNALNLTLRLLKKAKTKDFSSITEMEINLAKHLSHNNQDFKDIVGNKLYSKEKLEDYYKNNENYKPLSEEQIDEILFSPLILKPRKHLLLPWKHFKQIPEHSLQLINQSDIKDVNIKHTGSKRFLLDLGININAMCLSKPRKAIIKLLQSESMLLSKLQHAVALETDPIILSRLEEQINNLNTETIKKTVKERFEIVKKQNEINKLVKVSSACQLMASLQKKRFFIDLKKGCLKRMINQKAKLPSNKQQSDDFTPEYLIKKRIETIEKKLIENNEVLTVLYASDLKSIQNRLIGLIQEMLDLWKGGIRENGNKGEINGIKCLINKITKGVCSTAQFVGVETNDFKIQMDEFLKIVDNYSKDKLGKLRKQENQESINNEAFAYNEELLNSMIDIDSEFFTLFKEGFNSILEKKGQLNENETNLNESESQQQQSFEKIKLIFFETNNTFVDLLEFLINSNRIKLNILFSSEVLLQKNLSEVESLRLLYSQSSPTFNSSDSILNHIEETLIFDNDNDQLNYPSLSNSILNDHFNIPKNFETTSLYNHLTNFKLTFGSQIHNNNKLLIEDYLSDSSHQEILSRKIPRLLLDTACSAYKEKIIKMIKLMIIFIKNNNSFNYFDKDGKVFVTDLDELLENFKFHFLEDPSSVVKEISPIMSFKNLIDPVSYEKKNQEIINNQIKVLSHDGKSNINRHKSKIKFNLQKSLQKYYNDSEINVNEIRNILLTNENINLGKEIKGDEALDIFNNNKHKILSFIKELVPKPDFSDVYSLEQYVFVHNCSSETNAYEDLVLNSVRKMVSIGVKQSYICSNRLNIDKNSKNIQHQGQFREFNARMMTDVIKHLKENKYEPQIVTNSSRVLYYSGLKSYYGMRHLLPKYKSFATHLKAYWDHNLSLNEVVEQRIKISKSKPAYPKNFQKQIEDKTKELNRLNKIKEEFSSSKEIEFLIEIYTKDIETNKELLRKEIVKSYLMDEDKPQKISGIGKYNIAELAEGFKNFDAEIDSLETKASILNNRSTFDTKMFEVYQLEACLKQLIDRGDISEQSYSGYLHMVEKKIDDCIKLIEERDGLENGETSNWDYESLRPLTEGFIERVTDRLIREAYAHSEENEARFNDNKFDEFSKDEQIKHSVHSNLKAYLLREIKHLKENTERKSKFVLGKRDSEIQSTKTKSSDIDENEKQKYLFEKAHQARIMHEFKQTLKNENLGYQQDFDSFKRNRKVDVTPYTSDEVLDFIINQRTGRLQQKNKYSLPETLQQPKPTDFKIMRTVLQDKLRRERLLLDIKTKLI